MARLENIGARYGTVLIDQSLRLISPGLQKTSEKSLDGYRNTISLSSDVAETYQYDPHGGKLFI